MVRSTPRSWHLCAALCLPALAAVSPAAHALSSSPEALRKEAMRLFEKARSSDDNRREYYLLAEKKVLEALEILKGRSRRARTEEDLLVELQSLLYWIRKMTPLALPPAVRAPVAPKPAPPPRPEPGPSPGPRRRPERETKPKPSPPPASRSFRGLPARLEPIATAILKRYERAYKSHDEVEKMRYEFYLRDLRQAHMLRRHPKRSLEAAALVFEAIDRYDLDLIGSIASAIRMQACLELDRIYRTKPGKEMSYDVHGHLKNAYWNLAVCHYDFQPAVVYFNMISRKGVKHPDVKLGLALAKLAQSYVTSQARAKPATMARIGREDIGKWFGAYWRKVWCDAFRKYNWPKDKMKAVGDDSRRLFKEYAAEEPRGWIYEAYSETFWLWYYRKYKEFNAKSLEAFRRIDPAECTDAEKAMLRVLVTRWMRTNGHVNTSKVKWSK